MRGYRAVLVGVLSIVVAGCNPDPDGGGGASEAGADRVAESQGPAVGDPAPPYQARKLKGGGLSLASLEGKVVLLNFWATWCPPCREETPYLQSLYETHAGDGLEVVGVSLDGGDALGDVEAFVREYGVTYSILVDPFMRAREVFQLVTVPGSYLLDGDGVIRWVGIGRVSESSPGFVEALERLME